MEAFGIGDVVGRIEKGSEVGNAHNVRNLRPVVAIGFEGGNGVSMAGELVLRHLIAELIADPYRAARKKEYRRRPPYLLAPRIGLFHPRTLTGAAG